MKHLLLTTIAAVLLVGCGEAQQSPEALPTEPIAEAPAQPSSPPVEAIPVEPIAEAAIPEPSTAKAPDISIHEATTYGNIEAVKQHLAHGTDVEVKDVHGSTPLHPAAKMGHKETVELLIAKGADVNAKMEWAEVDSSEITAVQTPLDCAVDHPEIAALLRKHGGKTGEELKPAEPVAEASQPEPSTAKAPDISIHKAAERGNIEAVKQHLAAGTDVNAKNYQGMTP